MTSTDITVHPFKALSLTVPQTFARKIIRCIGGITESDIQREARAVSSLLQTGGHKNIVKILKHGELGLSGDCYFVDMELCDLTLQQYIAYWQGNLRAPFDITARRAPVFVRNDCSVLVRIQNLWTIARHIACGLEFMHGHKYVHRDLKPSNGTSTSVVIDFQSFTLVRRTNGSSLTLASPSKGLLKLPVQRKVA
jgi:serine/threonine protein kinase